MNRWVEAARLRTLPLALSVCFAAATSATYVRPLNYVHLVLLIVTIMSLQILSNYANDLGDFQNGGDDEFRNGPKRLVQAGSIQVKEMKMAVGVMILLSLIFGTTLLVISGLSMLEIAALFLFGLCAIWAAVRYTAGKNPYGYRALGDVAVFIFFGPLGVAGSSFLLCGELTPGAAMLSVVMGCFSMMVLNLNNLRDEHQDRRTHKITMIVKWGSRFGLIYNRLLFSAAVIFSLIWSVDKSWMHLLFTAVIFSFVAFVQRRILFWGSPEGYDSLMKPTALSAFLFSLIHFVLCIFTL